MNAAVLVAVMSLVTILLRFLPFLVFRDQTPAFITYLGKVLPSAIIGMLVVYCLKDVSISSSPHGLPEFAAAAAVVFLYVRKRNSLLSIFAGSAIYMILVRM